MRSTTDNHALPCSSSAPVAPPMSKRACPWSVAYALHLSGFWKSCPDRERVVHKTGRDNALYFSSAIGKPLRRTLLLVGVLVGLGLGTPWGAWALTYSFTIFDLLGALSTNTGGMNNAGQVVGHGPFPPFSSLRGFVYKDGSFSMLDVAGAGSTWAEGINNHGQIVGSFQDTTIPHQVHGFIYEEGSFRIIDVPSSLGGNLISRPTDINDTGQIVGFFHQVGLRKDTGFFYSGGNFSLIDVTGSSYTVPAGINATGQIVGYFGTATGRSHGFLYTGGSFSPIDVPDALYTIARGINNAGQIVGTFVNAATLEQHGFIYTDGSFSIIDVPGSIYTYATGINDKGQIAGMFEDATGQHGFIAMPIPTSPPVITIRATPETLWPPNGKLVSVTLTGTITDADSGVDPSAATYTVMDEYKLVQPQGSFIPAANGSYAFTIHLQASRNGSDKDGREYTITVRAEDLAGNEGSAATSVIVPHD
jgi:probable HAF family extracellular repeat protein